MDLKSIKEELQKDNLPLSLYKFKGNPDHFFDEVINNYIYLSKISEFNDPFEGLNKFIFEGSNLEIQKFVAEVVKEIPSLKHHPDYSNQIHSMASKLKQNPDILMRGMNDLLTKTYEKISFGCFTNVRDNLLMWGYYANGHNGVCIKYNTANLISSSNGSNLIQVEYSKTIPSFNYVLDFTNKEKLGSAVLSTKSEQWKHEQEYRLINRFGGKRIDLIPGTIEEIIFGCKCSDSDVEKLVSRIPKELKPMTITRTEKDNSDFKLVFSSNTIL